MPSPALNVIGDASVMRAPLMAAAGKARIVLDKGDASDGDGGDGGD